MSCGCALRRLLAEVSRRIAEAARVRGFRRAARFGAELLDSD
jgi:hypothetical protein